MLNTVVFDLDGTLADTLGDIAKAANIVLKSYGHAPYPVDDYRTFVGEGMRVLVERVLRGRLGQEPSKVLVAEAYAGMEATYARHAFDTTTLYPGVRALLDRLREANVPCAVLSNKPHPFTVEMVERLFEPDDFARVYGHRPPLPRKPDPSTLLSLVAELGATTDQVAYIGDTRTDMETAVAANVLPVGVAWGFRTVAELREHGAKRVVDHPLEVAALIGLEL